MKINPCSSTIQFRINTSFFKNQNGKKESFQIANRLEFEQSIETQFEKTVTKAESKMVRITTNNILQHKTHNDFQFFLFEFPFFF